MTDDLPEWALREARIALTSAEESWIAAAPAVVRRGPIENSAFQTMQSRVARALVAARRAGREEMRERAAALSEDEALDGAKDCQTHPRPPSQPRKQTMSADSKRQQFYEVLSDWANCTKLHACAWKGIGYTSALHDSLRCDGCGSGFPPIAVRAALDVAALRAQLTARDALIAELVGALRRVVEELNDVTEASYRNAVATLARAETAMTEKADG